MKILTGKALDREIKRHIRYSTKAPKNWAQRRQIIRETGTDLAVGLRKRGFRLPWALMIIIGVVLVAVILFIVFRDKGEYGEGKGGITPGERPDEPVDLKGRDVEGLLRDFGHGKPGEGGQGQPGRPFDEG